MASIIFGDGIIVKRTTNPDGTEQLEVDWQGDKRRAISFRMGNYDGPIVVLEPGEKLRVRTVLPYPGTPVAEINNVTEIDNVEE